MSGSSSQPQASMSIFKPNKPSTFDGSRDELVIRTWIYQVDQYLKLVQVGGTVALNDETKISFASTFMTGTAAAWWYTLVVSNTIPKTWAEFQNAIFQEFVPFDSTQRARDKLRKLIQRTSVSEYLTEFRNLTLTITGMNEEEKVDRFIQGLKPHVRLEVLKSNARTMNDASRIALNVDSALFNAGMFRFQGYRQDTAPTPMEIGNVEQHEKDRRNNACFRCHKVGCRPFKCDPSKRRRKPQARVSNTKAVKIDRNEDENLDSGKE